FYTPFLEVPYSFLFQATNMIVSSKEQVVTKFATLPITLLNYRQQLIINSIKYLEFQMGLIFHGSFLTFALGASRLAIAKALRNGLFRNFYLVFNIGERQLYTQYIKLKRAVSLAGWKELLIKWHCQIKGIGIFVWGELKKCDLMIHVGPVKKENKFLFIKFKVGMLYVVYNINGDLHQAWVAIIQQA
ncbi:hypothetical protein ACJX0J_029052, partial [Zea mays]